MDAEQRFIRRLTHGEMFKQCGGDVSLEHGQTYARVDDYDRDQIDVIDIAPMDENGFCRLDYFTISLDCLNTDDRRRLAKSCREWGLMSWAKNDKETAYLAYAREVTQVIGGNWPGDYYTALLDRFYHDKEDERRYQKYYPGHRRRVPGYGIAAMNRALDNCLDGLVGGDCTPPHETID